MTKEKICGIYCIENLINNKVYIGQSIDVYQRLSSHKSALKHNRHDNTYLQHAYNKYGAENFDFSILCECTPDELDNLERYYILDVYNSTDRSKGYNRESGGTLRKIVSKETRKKISEAGKRRFQNPEEIEKNRERISKLYENPEMRKKASIAQKKRFESPEERKKDSERLLEFYSTERGKAWIENHKETMSTYWNNEDWCNKMREKSNYKDIVQLNLDMTIENMWHGLRQIEKELKGFYRTNINKCLNNSYGIYGNGYKNFIWLEMSFYKDLTQEQINEYMDRFKNYDFEKSKTENRSSSRVKNRIIQLDLDMNFVKTWNSATSPKREGTEFCSSPIRRCCEHQTKSYKGFVWMYEKEYLELLENQKGLKGDKIL